MSDSKEIGPGTVYLVGAAGDLGLITVKGRDASNRRTWSLRLPLQSEDASKLGPGGMRT